MKKLLIVLTSITALTVMIYTSGFGVLDSDLKKEACVKACETTYSSCMDAAKKALDKMIKDGGDKATTESKKVAEEAACKEAKDECIGKCGK